MKSTPPAHHGRRRREFTPLGRIAAPLVGEWVGVGFTIDQIRYESTWSLLPILHHRVYTMNEQRTIIDRDRAPSYATYDTKLWSLWSPRDAVDEGGVNVSYAIHRGPDVVRWTMQASTGWVEGTLVTEGWYLHPTLGYSRSLVSAGRSWPVAFRVARKACRER